MGTFRDSIVTKDFVKNSWIPKVANLSGTTVSFQVNTVDQKSGVVTPGYRKLRQSGVVLPVHPYSRLVVDVPGLRGLLPIQYFAREKSRPDGYTEWETYSGAVPLNYVTNITSHYNSIRSRRDEIKNGAKAKLSDHISNVQWQSPVDIVELDKTASMVRDRFLKTVKFLEEFRKINRRVIKKAFRALTNDRRNSLYPHLAVGSANLAGELNNMFLEFTYGWNPLAMSVEDALTFLKERSEKHVRRKVSGHDFVAATKFTKTTSYPLPGSGLAVICDYLHETTWRYDAWYGGLFSVEYESSDREKLGLAITEVPATLWELTTFSFLADYFINIGDVINNLRANFRLLNQSTMYFSEKLVVEDSCRVERLRFNDTSRKLSFDSKSIGEAPRVRSMMFNRSPLTYGQALVSLNLKTPNFGNLFNTLSVISSVSGVLGKRQVHRF